MSKLTWDKTGEHFYETGVSQGVLYKFAEGKYASGVAWNGLSAVNETPSGGEANAVYADNIKYLSLISAEDYGFTIEAYSYPKGFEKCVGEDEVAVGVVINQQTRSHFGFCYRTMKGNDSEGMNHGYKIHLIFDCAANGGEKSHNTINDSPEAMTHSWDISTTPAAVDGNRSAAKLTIDSNKMIKAGLANVLHAIEDALYGTESSNPRMPDIKELMTMIDTHTFLMDSNGKPILDSKGEKMRSAVYD